MRRHAILLACLISAVAGASPTASNQAATAASGNAPVLFEGARLIVGDASGPIENSAFIVEGGKIGRVGRKGEIQLPAGAVRVDLTGKTVIPTLISTHVHIRLLDGVSFGPQNYKRDVLIDHLKRYAYYGVGAVLSAGTDVGPLSFQVRKEQPQGAARLLTAGRGMAAPDAGACAARLKTAAQPSAQRVRW